MIDRFLLLALIGVLCVGGCGKDAPPVAEAKFSYPDRVKVVEPSNGGPGIWQPLTPEFRHSSTLAKEYPKQWEAMVGLVATSAVVNNKNCDSLDFLSPMPLANHVAFRVGCIGKDGHYRTYVMSRHVDSQGWFQMAYTK
jgi:hypothetical protein